MMGKSVTLWRVEKMRLVRAFFLVSPWPYRVLRIGLGLVFVWAGSVKIMDPRAFARSISGYGLLPDPLLAPSAVGLPALELLAGAGLLLDVRGSLKAVSGLLSIFLSVLAYAIANGLDVDCGCFSPEEIRAHDALWTAFLRDLGMLGVASYLFVWKRFRIRSVAAGESETALSGELKEELA